MDLTQALQALIRQFPLSIAHAPIHVHRVEKQPRSLGQARRVASSLLDCFWAFKQIAAGTLVSDSFLRACSEKEKQPFFCCSFIGDPLLSIQTIIHTFGQVP